ncbi:MAG: sigma-70 family RNA polymerase sigma factor [Actinobacteria bacterium]|nr:sigma-70 family RNA polymerase sigma factor [Actinomycetota bacterium]
MATVLAPRRRFPAPRRALRDAHDEQLVAEVRAGSRSGFEAVYDRYHAGILAFCRHMLGSREEAEDAVQHTFASAYGALVAEDEPEIALRPWLYAIARNRCFSILRARREHVPLEDATLPATAGLSAEVEQREDLRALLVDLQRLPDDQRAALILAELGAQPYDEIALALAVPPGKIKALVFQARETLASRRIARDADCTPIREQLAVVRGGARRRRELRDHVAQCEGCRAFEADVRRQRAGMSVLLPVAPTLALKDNVLAGAFAGAGSGSATAAGGAAGGAAVSGTSGAAGGTASGAAATVATTGGAAAVGGAGASSFAAVAGGGVVLFGKVIGANAVTGLVIAAVAAGGGYVAAKELRSDGAAPAAQAASAQTPSAERSASGAPAPGVTPVNAANCAPPPGAGAAACTTQPAAAAKASPAAASTAGNACLDPSAGPASGCGAAADPAALPAGQGSGGPVASGTSAPADDCPSTLRAIFGNCDQDEASDRAPRERAPAARGPHERSPAGRSPAGRSPAGRGPTGRGPAGRSPAGGGPAERGPVDRDRPASSDRDDKCPGVPANTASGCRQPAPVDPPPGRSGAPDGNGSANGADKCADLPASTASGCDQRAPADPPAGRGARGDVDGDGTPGRSGNCRKVPTGAACASQSSRANRSGLASRSTSTVYG